MKNFFRNLTTKDRILLVGTIIILLAIASILAYNSLRPQATIDENGAIVEPLSEELHELSDEAPPREAADPSPEEN